jgi:hypothetical protein
MKRFLLRMRNILFRPGQEWRVIGQEQASAGNLVKPYALIMAALPPFAALAERLLFGRTVAGRQPLALVLATNAVWYLVILVNVVIAASVFTVIIRSGRRRLLDLQGIQFATYSFTPLFLVSVVLTMVPAISWLTYAAILYSFSLLYVGIRVTTGEGQRTAAWHAFASCVVAGLIVGSLNAVEYMAESFIASKVFY